MKRIGILTAGGDTPALNATTHGAVSRANQLRVEVFRLIEGFNGLLNPRVPHSHLNPLFQPIPELDATQGGTLIGSSRDYIDPNDATTLSLLVQCLEQLGIEGLIHARPMHPSFHDAMHLRPSRVGVEYLQQIFTNALGEADLEYVGNTAFAPASSPTLIIR